MSLLEEKKWVVIYTRSRHEKSVAKQLSDIGVANFLPLRETIRVWSDRKKMVVLPLFPNYVFIYVEKNELQKLPEIVGYIKTIYLNGQIAVVSEKEIECIKLMLNSPLFVATCNSNLKVYDKIEVIEGPLLGYVGQLIDFKGKKRLAIKIEAVGSSIIVDINPDQIKKV